MRLFFLLSILVVLGCGQPTGNNLPGYSGRVGEIVVVINKLQWKSVPGDAIRSTLGSTLLGLTKPEPQFELINLPAKSFNQVLKSHRNVLVANIHDTVITGKVYIKRNVWARNQVVVEINAKTPLEFAELTQLHESYISTVFARAELNRLIKRNKKFGNEKINEKLKAHHISITPQKDFKVVTNTPNFIWIRLERERPVGGFQHQISQGILIYHYPYKDTSQLHLQNLLQMRDSITRKYIPGPVDSAYMEVSKRHDPPITKETAINGNYAIENRGVWRMHNGFMAGPFISITTIDTTLNRVITADGYVYCPQFEKREYLRELEAMVKSIKFTK